MKVIKHNHGVRTDATRSASTETSPGISTSEKRYLIWGILRLVLGIMQMTFAAAAILNLIFVGLSKAALAYAGVATIATVVSRLMFRGRTRPPR